MSWGEAFRLTQRLSADPSSAVGAEMAKWDHPISREALVLMDVFDLQHASKSKRRPKAYRRPWADKSTRTFGRTALTREELRAVLDAQRATPASGVAESP